MSKTEHRAAIELRAEGRRLEGYAAPFGVPTKIFDFTETVQRGAFSKTLRSGADILAPVDHDRTRVLARTKAGTLRLSEDARGLRFEPTICRTRPPPMTSWSWFELATQVVPALVFE